MGRKQVNAEILANKKIQGRYFKMILRSPLIAKSALPGQFVMLKVGTGRFSEPFLRRPLGIHKAAGKEIEILYEVVGEGTKFLSQRRPGEDIDLLGPLGSGFDYCSRKIAIRRPILVAGGIGVAPLLLLAERLVLVRRSQSAGKIAVLIGARTKDQILCEKEFKKIGCDVKIATDDGSAGFSGRVTVLLEKQLVNMNHHLAAVYACGPQPMLKELDRICRKNNVPAQVSLEAHMACGIGACLGCVVNTKNGYKRVCQDGPVFRTENLIY
jgi:dihydroorotate dehydrogenase electron transfer subunit